MCPYVPGSRLLLGQQRRWPDRQRANRGERARPDSAPIATGRRRKITLAGTEFPYLRNQHRWRPVLLGTQQPGAGWQWAVMC